MEYRPSKRRVHNGYTIVLTQIERDWSEDAWEYKVEGTAIKDECEGFDNAVMYAQQEIDKL
jgi:hypothetical protein